MGADAGAAAGAGAAVGVGVGAGAAVVGGGVAGGAAEDVTAAVTGAEPVDADVGTEYHQLEGSPEAANWCGEVGRPAAFVEDKGNDVVVAGGALGSATAAAAVRPAEWVWMRRAKCKLRGLSPRMQLGGCCAADWEWGKMQRG